MTTRIMVGHVLERLRELPAESVHCVVTSPPYYGLRDYGIEPQMWGGDPDCKHEFNIEEVAAYSSKGNWQQAANGTQLVTGKVQTRHAGDLNSAREKADSKIERGFCRHCSAWRGSLGLEPTLALYLDHMVEICREIRRVLRKDGTFWLNLGDSYAGSWGAQGRGGQMADRSIVSARQIGNHPQSKSRTGSIKAAGLKPKDLMLIPSRLAIRLCDDGWWVRSDIAWCKRAPMPESVTDRPTTAWEHVFLLTKSARYFYDAEAVKENFADERMGNPGTYSKTSARSKGATQERKDLGFLNNGGGWNADGMASGRNMRNFWLLGPEPFPEAHFATFPTEIPRRAILAGSKPGDTILDPFFGPGTTGLVADQLQRHCIGIELKPEYAELARRRIEGDSTLFAQVAAD